MNRLAPLLIGLVISLAGYLPAAAQIIPAVVEAVDTTGLRNKPKSLIIPPVYITNAVFDYSLVDTTPQFKGGEAGLRRFLSQNLRFPPALLRAHVEGRTEVSFIVDVNGDIRNPRVYKSLCQPWDDEVMRVVKLLDQKFQPATYNSRPVAAPYSLSVPFLIK